MPDTHTHTDSVRHVGSDFFKKDLRKIGARMRECESARVGVLCVGVWWVCVVGMGMGIWVYGYGYGYMGMGMGMGMLWWWV
jgi:hypothetical protein